MTQNAQSLVDAASRLPEAERWQVFEGLLATLEPIESESDEEVARAWQAEAVRRSAELKSGTVKPVPWSDVKAAGERLFDAND